MSLWCRVPAKSRALCSDSRFLSSLREMDYNNIIADPGSLIQVPKHMRQLPGKASQARIHPTPCKVKPVNLRQAKTFALTHVVLGATPEALGWGVLFKTSLVPPTSPICFTKHA